MTYRIQFEAGAEKALAKLPMPVRRRIALAINKLADDSRPQGVRKLTKSKNSYRLRVRDYRIVYDIADKLLIIRIVRIGHQPGRVPAQVGRPAS